MIVRCPRCPKTWTGTTASHCTVCHETFSVDSNGDRHRKGKGADRRCVHPSTVGLVLNKRGRWAMPAGDYDPVEAREVGILPCGCVPPCEGHHEDES